MKTNIYEQILKLFEDTLKKSTKKKSYTLKDLSILYNVSYYQAGKYRDLLKTHFKNKGMFFNSISRKEGYKILQDPEDFKKVLDIWHKYTCGLTAGLLIPYSKKVPNSINYNNILEELNTYEITNNEVEKQSVQRTKQGRKLGGARK